MRDGGKESEEVACGSSLSFPTGLRPWASYFTCKNPVLFCETGSSEHLVSSQNTCYEGKTRWSIGSPCPCRSASMRPGTCLFMSIVPVSDLYTEAGHTSLGGLMTQCVSNADHWQPGVTPSYKGISTRACQGPDNCGKFDTQSHTVSVNWEASLPNSTSPSDLPGFSGTWLFRRRP